MFKVLVDAGHYGFYNRSPVNPAYYESIQMWKLTELVAKELTALGVAVIKTRTNQKKDLALIARGKKAKGCDAAISFHSNAAGAESVDYVVALVLRDNDRTDIDEKSEDLGLRLAKVVTKTIGTKQPARTAEKGSSNDRDGNGIRDDEYYGFLEGARRAGTPALILENGFHTNTETTNWLMSDANLAKLAKAEALEIVAWLKENCTTKPGAAPVVKPAATPAPAVKIEAAHLKDPKLSRRYSVTALSGLWLRTGAGTNKGKIKLLPKGLRVNCYGYYNQVGNTKWLYIAVTDTRAEFIAYKGLKGFVSSAYLK